VRKVTATAQARASRRKPASNAKRAAGSRAGLARDDIVAASLALLQKDGIVALSTRQLAARLGVQSPALYWHVRGKQELLELVADAICGEMHVPDEDRPARLRLEAIASEYRRVLTTYRDAPRLLAELPPTGPHRIALYDAAVGAFSDSGFTAAEAIAMATFYRHFLLGMIGEETRQAALVRTGKQKPAKALAEELSQLGDDALNYPHLRNAAAFLSDVDADAAFRLGLSVFLDGVAGRAATADVAPKKPRRVTHSR
jgi:TetR/AcrR family transcriptional regulator, tetracycline repressor protein